MRLWGRFKGLGGTGSPGKNQKGGVAPPRVESREAGQALITLLALDGTCNSSQRIRRTGPRRSSSPVLPTSLILPPSHCCAVSPLPGECPPAFPIHAFWRGWARRTPQLGDDWNLERQSNRRRRRRYRRVSSPSGRWMQQISWESTGSPRLWDTNRPSWLGGGLVAFQSPALTLHRSPAF
jgi:hypothetical protein